MDKKSAAMWQYRWKDEVIAAGLLLAAGFLINAGIQIKGLFMDDLYLWSCYGEQSFREFVFPIGSTRFRFLYYLAAYLELGLVGSHVTWFVPINIVFNAMVAYTVCLFARKLSGNQLIGLMCGFLYLLSRMSCYQIAQVYGLMETLALWAAVGILWCLYEYINGAGERFPCFWGACGLYFAVCFIHERYMVLLPLFSAGLVMKKDKKPRQWLLPIGLFVLVQGIRLAFIGTISPAGTGGTHVADTGQIACFKILSEAGIAANVRRIEALTAQGLMDHYQEEEAELLEAAKLARTTPADLKAKIGSMLEEIKALHAENEKLRAKMAKDSVGDIAGQTREVKGVKLLAIKVDGADMSGLRDLGDQLKEKLGEGVIVLASVTDGKVNLMATATEGAMAKGAHAGNLIKGIARLVGGGGGGRPNMAQAGGKDPGGVDGALAEAAKVLEGQIR